MAIQHLALVLGRVISVGEGKTVFLVFPDVCRLLHTLHQIGSQLLLVGHVLVNVSRERIIIMDGACGTVECHAVVHHTLSHFHGAVLSGVFLGFSFSLVFKTFVA